MLVLIPMAAVLAHPYGARRLISRGVAATGLRDPDPAVLRRIVASLPGVADPSERVDAARAYVHRSSQHAIDAEHARYAFDTPRVLARLLKTSEDGAPPPHLSCGPRAFALGAIVQAMGYERRFVSLFKADGFLVHSLLEVKNPSTGRWELQDPDMNFVYVREGARLSARDLLLSDVADGLDRVHAEGGGDVADWARLRGGAEGGYFAAILYNGAPDHARSRVLVNARRLDPDAVDRTTGRTFRDHAQALYGDARIEEVE